MTPSRLGCRIWPWTAPTKSERGIPSLIARWKASSRFGPVVPLVLARESTWHEPLLARDEVDVVGLGPRRAGAEHERGARHRKACESGSQAGSGEHGTHPRGTLSQATGGSSTNRPCAAATTPAAT